jgi:succinyl-diaminopimelate desuccinylase
MIAAGFSYEVVTAHNGCLQMEVTVHGEMAMPPCPDSGVDALQGAVHILNALYALNAQYQQVTPTSTGITHPYLNVGRIEGGTNTNVSSRQGGVQARPPHDPRRKPDRGGSAMRRTIEQAGRAPAARRAVSRWTSSACCWPAP